MSGGTAGATRTAPAGAGKLGPEPHDVSLVQGDAARGLLGTFNRAGVLSPADVHVALRLTRMGSEQDEEVALAVALAVRAPRAGHVSVDLATVRAVAIADGPGGGVVAGARDGAGDPVDLDLLPWPEPAGWLERVSASPLVTTTSGAPGAAGERPLHLEGSCLYLDRYWRDEQAVGADLRSRAEAPSPELDEAALGETLSRLHGDGEQHDQRRAVAMAACRPLAVIAGGPGTGKTTAVARLLAVLQEQAEARGERPPLVALAAPTGRAAARLEEAVRAEAALMNLAGPTRDRLMGLRGSTLHRLLGSRPSTARFRHNRGHRLPHDAIVVDEASMISLWLMARLLEAARPDARLVLVGDPEQLVSVEAGAVLADVVGPAGTLAVGDAGGTSVLGEAAGTSAGRAYPDSPMAASIALLRTNYRFAGALAELASAVRAGDADATLDVLSGGDPSIEWLAADPEPAAATLRDPLTAWADDLVAAARQGDRAGALEELGRHRLLCAHREGPAGVSVWNDRVQRWLAGRRPGLAGEGAWYAGRPVIVTANDYSLQLFNGDAGVSVAGRQGADGEAGDGAPRAGDSSVEAGDGSGPAAEDPPGVLVAFHAGGGTTRAVSPSRLTGVETAYAMTVHKSQGSEFDRVTLLLPPAGSRLLSRELLYTAVTRARQSLVVAGTEESVRAAVARPIARASGLARILWGPRAGHP